MTINILSAEIVSRIAAGEVVERPASVVKELVENSLDAGAFSIEVESRMGGIALIRVRDYGQGIPANEVELAFQRYATSKIANINDLENIESLGFRGEALPSIAAVAEVEMLTRYKDEETGTYLKVKDGNISVREPRGAPAGTTVTVRNLFRHIPARLKFLKSTSTENNRIIEVVTQYALAWPGVRFTLLIDGGNRLLSGGSGVLRDTITDIYGATLAGEMLEINEKEEHLGIWGYISPPSINRSSRNQISFFVNHRWVQSRLLSRSLEEACSGYIVSGRFPVAVVNIQISPGDMDVNVHPAKTQVRFRQEPFIFAMVKRAIVKALATKEKIVELRTPLIVKHETPATELWKNEIISTPAKAEPFMAVTASGTLPILRVLGQLSLTYILAEGPEGLYLIDQHAAHERVLFERLLSQANKGEVPQQALLEPMLLELTASEAEILQSFIDNLKNFGFTIEIFGPNIYKIQTVPAMLAGKDVVSALREIISTRSEVFSADKRMKETARSIACHGAIKAGVSPDMNEMRSLVADLENCREPRHCPHGRPTMVHLSSEQLQKEFGR